MITWKSSSQHSTTVEDGQKSDETVTGFGGVRHEYTQITPLATFRWQDTPPLKLRPFKPKFHLSLCMIPRPSRSEY